MYVSVPKNYSGIAFPRDNPVQEMQRRDMQRHDMPLQPMTMPLPMPPAQPQVMHEPPREECRECREPPAREEKSPCACDGCQKQEKNPLTCLLTALRDRGKAGFDTEDFLLIGLIVLLLGKEGNEDVVLILAMLLLI